VSETKLVGMSARRTAIIGGLMVATGPLSLGLYQPALPTIVQDLAISESAGKLTLTVYFASFALAQLLCGPLSDRFGRRSIGMVFFAIYVLGSLLCTFAPNIEMLFLGRFVQGFGVSAGVALSRAMVRDQFVGAEAIRILTMVNLILTVTPAVAPTLGSVILAFGPWHVMFLIMAGFGLAILALLGFSSRETLPPERRIPFSPSVIFKNYKTLLTSKDFIVPALLLGLTFGGFHGFTALLPFVLINDLGLTPFQFAMAMLLQTGCYTIGNVLAGVLASRTTPERIVSLALVCFALSGVSFIMMPLLLPTSMLAIMLPVGIWMVGLALVGPSVTTAAMAGFGTIAGAAAAMSGFLQMGGGFIGSLIGSTLFPNARTAIMVELPIIAALIIALALYDKKRRGPAV
jgi:DHA1 family bicyclomycin/chloramphenicol resistance-like MFS transporter